MMPGTATYYDEFSSESELGQLSEGEETDDASESESYNHQEIAQYTEMKEQIYQDKINNLKKQLQQLSEGNHPEWLKRLKRLDNQLKERLFINTVIKELELEMAEQDFLSEEKNVKKEFEEKKVYLKEQLLSELEEKQKNCLARIQDLEATHRSKMLELEEKHVHHGDRT